MLERLTKDTVTPDRRKEFTYHQKLSDQLKIEVYFPALMLHGMMNQWEQEWIAKIIFSKKKMLHSKSEINILHKI